MLSDAISINSPLKANTDKENQHLPGEGVGGQWEQEPLSGTGTVS